MIDNFGRKKIGRKNCSIEKIVLSKKVGRNIFSVTFFFLTNFFSKIFLFFSMKNVFDDFFFRKNIFCSPISIPNFPKIPKIALRKSCDEYNVNLPQKTSRMYTIVAFFDAAFIIILYYRAAFVQVSKIFERVGNDLQKSLLGSHLS